MVRVAIVGGGAGATEFVRRLVEASGGQDSYRIVIFEPRVELGRGIAWRNLSRRMIANMKVETLGPSSAELALIDRILHQLTHPEAGKEFPSRNAMGDALAARWLETLSQMGDGWSCAHRFSAVVNIIPQKIGFKVVCERGETWLADIVVLAIGNVGSNELANQLTGCKATRVVSGWDESGIYAIPPDADVLVRGSSLTAIDATLRMLEVGERGRRGSIVWQSRSGLLPFVRPREIKLEPRYLSYASIADLLSKKGTVTLEDLWKLFQLEMRAHQQGGGIEFAANSTADAFRVIRARFQDPSTGLQFLKFGLENADQQKPCLWYSVAKLMNEYLVPLVWNGLSEAERVRFLAKFRREYDRFKAAIPPQNGQQLLGWLETNTLQLVRATGPYRCGINHSTLLPEDAEDPLGKLSKQKLDRRYSNGFKYVIDAGGIPTDLTKLKSELVAQLVQDKILVPLVFEHEGRRFSVGARADWFSGRIQSPVLNDNHPLYALTGSLMAGAHRFTNSYLAVSASAQRAANDIVRRTEVVTNSLAS